ncbi:uncharacterized protein [Typha latifolia]|uniref:uncharacterized protein n=1 Tax=Typha latifolia TaxID=4733 RepID=UPI003C2FAFED
MRRRKNSIAGAHLFICFTSGSMRTPSSKSLPSPGRTPAPATAATSLSSSLSRRLRGSRSLKGGQSPMFPTAMAAEPSSPKVTCIGQVRVRGRRKKAKAKGASFRSRSMRGFVGEASLRRNECSPSKNPRWVYQIPISICGSLRAFGSELSCLLPCGGRSLEKGGECGKKLRASARWVMGEERGKGEVGLESKEIEVEVEEKDEVLMVGEEEGRVSVCIPPKNALLLMRCRSDPVRMAALESRFWDSPATKIQGGGEEEEEESNEERDQDGKIHGEVGEEEGGETVVAQVVREAGEVDLIEGETDKRHQGVVFAAGDEELGGLFEGKEPTLDKEEEGQEEKQDASEKDECIIKNAILEAEKTQLHEEPPIETAIREEEKVKRRRERRRSDSSREKEARRHSFSVETRRASFSNEREARRASFSVDKESKRRWSLSIEHEDIRAVEKAKKATTKKKPCSPEPEEGNPEEAQVVGEGKQEDDDGGGGALPDCLLLMMYEPKLSMEVSKETWVCTNDFVHHPRRHLTRGAGAKAKAKAKKEGEGDGEGGEANVVIAPVEPAPKPPPPVPAPRSPPCEPLALTRCKSEPVRTASRLAPDACFWKERHRPIGAAGVGF